MTKRKDSGYLLPATPKPLTGAAVCVCVPCDPNHALAFLGQIKALGDWWNWQADSARTGKDAAQAWRQVYIDVNRQLNESGVFGMTGCGCGSPLGRLTRIDDNGNLQVSDDGGETWTDAPEIDPRNTSLLFPPLDAEAGEATKCAAAANVTSKAQTLVAELANGVDVGLSVAEVIAVAVAFVATILSEGTLLPFAAAMVAAVFDVGAAAFLAAFDSGVWEDFNCIIYCHVQDDGSFNSGDVLEIKADINSKIASTTARLWLVQFVDSMGTVGLTNAGRTGTTSASGCEECDCTDCPECTLEAATSINFPTPNAMPDGFGVVDMGTNSVSFFVTDSDDCAITTPNLCVVRLQWTQDTYLNDGTTGLQVVVGAHSEDFYNDGVKTMDFDPPIHTEIIHFELLGVQPSGGTNISGSSFTIYYCP